MARKERPMESRVKLLGHPIHPMLIVLPLGLLAMAVVFDVIYLVSGDDTFANVAFWDITAGVIAGLAAAIFGFLDWLAIPNDTRAKKIGLFHGTGNLIIVVLFIVSWFLRLGNHAYAPNLLPFALALIGAVMALGTAWLGGELVYRLRVAVDDGAGLDAPSSLATGAAAPTASPSRRDRADITR
jgi:uncharacterized membrane protein